ncbi:MFS transporter [Virgibacillus pantothenticus]|uniref:MFS transporter n=1 Tax=Virgibacillus pantothenticus TaxID=1473 RepID=UPI001C22EF98|nr:MFS transporter [Virgibacillus pantothenticus]MBU8568257.1 MFS transporter [Virgibacillus pantothenticus]MBU8602281.1 MFS transporter [Virgibacillus pantothenticus]MBU8636415.1 MFS transporter [Virgibacillus pantothenticus]MBU8644169.1 MFS transporter [Virgibacillus pantothenticus]MBU8648350.1 MFS transporter [Virgibacillus pantothenticus]
MSKRRFAAKEVTGWKATIAISMANYIEAGSIIAAASSLTMWQAYLQIDSIGVGLLSALSANALGAALGALIGGPLTDKYGRKLIFSYDLLVYMIGVLLIAVSVNFPMLLLGTIITGIAVGAGVPVSWTYIAEESPESKRAAHVGTAQLAWSIGPMITFALAVLLAPLGLLGSRIIFFHLFIIAGISLYIRRGLPESKIWEEQQAKDLKDRSKGIKQRSSFKELISLKPNREALFLLLGIYLFWNLTAGAMGYFMPYIYENVGGLSNQQANLLQAFLWMFTVITTYLIFMKLGDKYSRKLIFGIGALMGVIAWIILTFMPMTWPTLISFVVLWGSAAGIGAQAFYALWTSELFPTRYRATAQGYMYFIVRTGIALWSFILPTIMATLGFKVAGIVMIVFLVIHMVIGIILAPNTRGKSLRQIEEERYGNLMASEKQTTV